jgi:hypothetical protein
MSLSPYATKPYCLDSEFYPRNLLDAGFDGLDEQSEKERGKAAYREFIRSLIFSPQVVIGRESTTGHPVLGNAVQKKKERDAIISLLREERIYIMLMVSRGKKGDRYQEKSLLDFFEHSQFRGQANDNAVKGWIEVDNCVGDSNIPYVRLDAEKSLAMESRFTSFYSIPPNHPSLIRVLGDSLGREPTVHEVSDFIGFWKEDVKHFGRWLQDQKEQYTLYRQTMYDEYIRPKMRSEFLESLAPSKRTDMIERRLRLRLPFKLTTDLAYNANAPATINIKSFVPPDMPDPVSLPMHLFQAVQYFDPIFDKQRNAVSETYAELIERRINAREQFFYDTQTYEHLPDIGSFTLSDAVEVMKWDEWRSFVNCQLAALRFERAEDLEQLMRDYWETIKTLHAKLEAEAKHRQHWRRVGRGAVNLSIAVTAHIMGHALLPDLMHSVPWWQTVAAATAVAQPLHAGLDIVVHGLARGSNLLLTELGFKDGGMREFTISREMQDKLQQLKLAEEHLAMDSRRQDAVVADASRRIAAEG